MPDWVARGVDEFVRRFPADMPVSFTEIAAGKRGKNADIPRILQKEGEATLAAKRSGLGLKSSVLSQNIVVL